MALDVNAIKLANLIDPEVLAPLINKKLVNLMKFAPLARVDSTLVGRPGSTVTLPNYTYIGDATDVAEGDDIPIGQLTQTSVTATIKKAGRGVQITDESVLSGYGDPISEAISQISLAIATKVDNDVLAVMATIGAGMTYDAGSATLDEDVVANALVKFGEDLDGDKVLLIAPAQLAQLRTSSEWIKATEMGVSALMSGVQGMIWGCQVVVSNKIVAVDGGYTNYIVKPGAFAVYLKKDVDLEADRDIINKSTVMTADKHYVAYLYDSSKAIKILCDATDTIDTINVSADLDDTLAVTVGSITEDLTFTVASSLGTTVTYQWYEADEADYTGDAISGETAGTFSIPTDAVAGTYYYYCIASVGTEMNVSSNICTVTASE